MDTISSALVAVADIQRSSSLSPADRRAVQAAISSLGTGLAGFRFTGGDEFEWRLPDLPASFDHLLATRVHLAAGDDEVPPVLLRIGMGRGPVDVVSTQTPYAEDGPAYHRARRAFETVRAVPARSRRSAARPFDSASEAQRSTAFDLGDTSSPIIAALLLHMDALMSDWSLVHWQAIDGILRGDTLEAIGERLRVSPQTVFKRLKTARFDLYLHGHAAIKAAVWGDAE